MQHLEQSEGPRSQSFLNTAKGVKEIVEGGMRVGREGGREGKGETHLH